MLAQPLRNLCVLCGSAVNRLFTAEAQRSQRIAAEMLVALLLMHELPCATTNEYNH